MADPAEKKPKPATMLETAMMKAAKSKGEKVTLDPGYKPGASSGHAMASYVRNGKATAQKKGWVPNEGWEAGTDTAVDVHPVVWVKYIG